MVTNSLFCSSSRPPSFSSIDLERCFVHLNRHSALIGHNHPATRTRTAKMTSAVTSVVEDVIASAGIDWDETSAWSRSMRSDLEEKENQVEVKREVKPQDVKPEVKQPEVKPGDSPRRVKSDWEELREVTAKTRKERSVDEHEVKKSLSNREKGRGLDHPAGPRIKEEEPGSPSKNKGRSMSFEEIPPANRENEQDSPLPFKIDEDDDGWVPTLEYLPVTSRETPPYQLDDDLTSGPKNDLKVKVRVTPDDPLVWEDDETTPLFHGFKPSEILYDVVSSVANG